MQFNLIPSFLRASSHLHSGDIENPQPTTAPPFSSATSLSQDHLPEPFSIPIFPGVRVQAEFLKPTTFKGYVFLTTLILSIVALVINLFIGGSVLPHLFTAALSYTGAQSEVDIKKFTTLDRYVIRFQEAASLNVEVSRQILNGTSQNVTLSRENLEGTSQNVKDLGSRISSLESLLKDLSTVNDKLNEVFSQAQMKSKLDEVTRVNQELHIKNQLLESKGRLVEEKEKRLHEQDGRLAEREKRFADLQKSIQDLESAAKRLEKLEPDLRKTFEDQLKLLVQTIESKIESMSPAHMDIQELRHLLHSVLTILQPTSFKSHGSLPGAIRA